MLHGVLNVIDGEDNLRRRMRTCPGREFSVMQSEVATVRTEFEPTIFPGIDGLKTKMPLVEVCDPGHVCNEKNDLADARNHTALRSGRCARTQQATGHDSLCTSVAHSPLKFVPRK